MSPEELSLHRCGWELVEDLLTARDQTGFRPDLLVHHLGPLREMLAGAPEPHRFFFIATQTKLALDSAPTPPEGLAEKVEATLQAYETLSSPRRNELHRSWKPSQLLDRALQGQLNPKLSHTWGSLALLRGLLSVKECSAYQALDDQQLISAELLNHLENSGESIGPEKLLFHISSKLMVGERAPGPTGTGDILTILLDYPGDCAATDLLLELGIDRARLDRFLNKLPDETYPDRSSMPSDLEKLRERVKQLLVPPDNERLYMIRGQVLLNFLKAATPELKGDAASNDSWLVPYYPAILAEDPYDPIWQAPIELASVFPLFQDPFKARYALASTVAIALLHDELAPEIREIAYDVMKLARLLK